MATITVSVPERMKDFIDAQVETGDFVDGEDYLRDLVRRDQDRRLAELRAIVEEGLASGISTRTAADIFAEAEETARVRGTLRD
jgi:antitoxin ParD1/3/4